MGECGCGHFWYIVTWAASSCAPHLPLKLCLKLKINIKLFKIGLPASESDIFTGSKISRKMREYFGDGPEYQRSHIQWLHFTQGETQPRSFRRKGTRARIKPGSSLSAQGSSMASPCLSGGVKLGRELDSVSQRHTIFYHSVNLTFQDMTEWETCQTDARVISWVSCKTLLHQNAPQHVWSSASGHTGGLHRAAGCGQMGHISLLGQNSDMSV